ncbi:efflux RND transporter periplasmic adaptor subunit [Aquibacillus koreensis]|uniref:Efflux RND transporter periplasmic adaptor subunit n=1 Tax=Aquibacillus koreensis TaxID=279446 RepID=A0A9X3WNC0_9BACI|nr:efflux RND transporter periplasmic adaptor subunit [Aquibacillus koreensis]MCT2536308.1 efflux RND transporter periplasmic adaptor subunit [Aquibacillus koreensis]MDC3421341.1 efflux RND transporter periplasmic adaptor subunit [Aquibacillus koreensis]
MLKIKWKKRYNYVTMVNSFVLVFLLTGCSLLPKEEETLAPPLVEPAEIEYEIAEVTLGEVVKRVSGTANVIPANSESLFYKQSGGRLEQIFVIEGDQVEKGQVLAEVDTGDLSYEIDQMEIEHQKAELRLQQLRAQGADQYAIEIAKLDVEGLTLRLNQYRDQLANAQITSPIDGLITYSADLKSGDYIEAFQPIVEVADTSNVQLIYTAMAANDLDDVKVGMPVSVTLEGDNLEGEVVQTPENVPDDVLSQDPDLYKRSILIRTIESDDTFDIGMVAQVEIITSKKDQALYIPKNALRTGYGRNYVQVLVDQTKREKDIEPGIISDTKVEVITGLSEGDQVILK